MSAAGERVRLAEQIARMRALLDGLESTVQLAVPCSEAAQAVADAGVRLTAAAARHDAYHRTETLSTADWRDVCDALMDAASVHHSGPRADRIEALRDKIREEMIP